jgi:glycosyltransferase involved in cell wall biosynthesis
MKKSDVIFFGASKIGEEAYELLKDKCNVVYFCDNNKNKWNKKFCGIEVVPPEILKTEEFKNIKIMITSTYYNEIYEQLKDMKIKNVEKITNFDLKIIRFKKRVSESNGMLLRSQILLENSNIKDAKYILEKCINIDQNDPNFFYFLSYLSGKDKNEIDAIKYFARAQMLAPSDININEIINIKNNEDNNDFKILFSPIDVANQFNLYSIALKKMGYTVTNLSYRINKFKYDYDEFIDIDSFNNVNEQLKKTIEVAADKISTYNIFHFIYGRSLTLDYSDLPLYKMLNKKVVMSCVGDDVRRYSKAIKLNPYWKIIKDDYFGKLGLLDEKLCERRLQYLSKYIDNCVVFDRELYEYTKDFYKKIYYINIPVNIEIYKPAEYENKRPLIIHAPSNTSVKGTRYVLSAIEELKLKYDFDFKLIQNVPHEEAKLIYSKADIAIDQLIAGGFGSFAVELMAMGKPVICYVSDFMKEYYPKEIPIVSATVENIKQKLEELLKDKEMRIEIGLKGIKYVKKYNDMNKVAESLIDIYKKIH